MYSGIVCPESGPEQTEVASWMSREAESRNEHHRTRLVPPRAGDGADWDIKRGKLGPDRIGDMTVPSVARVACIPREACTSLDQDSNK